MIEMSKEILKGEDFEYEALSAEIIKKIGINQFSDIPRRGGNGRKAKLLNLVAVFDSETSNYTVGDEKRPFIISEAMTFLNLDNNKNITVLFRHIEEYLKFMSVLSKKFGLIVNRTPVTDKYGNQVYDIYGNPFFDVSNDLYLTVYVHNLPFDASFLLPHMQVFQLFASGLHKPYYFVTNNGFKFVDTAVLTQNSLAGLGNKLQRFHVEKKVGDFDYDKIRTPNTPFTKKEEGYVLNDVLVLAAYIAEYAQDNYSGNLARLPMTQTGIVRDFLKRSSRGDWSVYLQLYQDHIVTKPVIMESFLQTLSNHEDDHVRGWFSWHQDLTVKQAVNFFFQSFTAKVFHDDHQRTAPRVQPDNNDMIRYLLTKLGGYKEPAFNLDHYKMFKQAYQGGFTHSNALHTGKVLQNVHSFDFTSSYPTRILSQYFAVADKMPVKLDRDQLAIMPKLIKQAVNHQQLLTKLYVFKFTADRLTLKDGINDGYLSSYYLKGDHKAAVNGRIIKAKNVEYTTTSIDWEIIRQVYDIENLQFVEGYEMEQEYLPRYVIAPTIFFYSRKTKLKHVKGRESDYMRSKQMLNSIYGCMVSDQTRPAIYYEDEDNTWQKWDYYNNWLNDKIKDQEGAEPVEVKIAKDNVAKSFMPYIWGVEVSAYARVALWRGILGAGDDYVYSDTDSLKLLNWQQHLKMIDKENKLIVSQIDACLNHYGINPINARPKDIKGKEHQLGVWDADDGDYLYFKTLGAKRYIDIADDHTFEITIAGLSKKTGRDFMLKGAKVHRRGAKVKLEPENIARLFNFFTNQMYVPAEATGKLASFYIDHVPAFKINGETIPAGGGCLLKPVDFTMGLTLSYLSLLDIISKGYRLDDTNYF